MLFKNEKEKGMEFVKNEKKKILKIVVDYK